ncbi:MAG TPA: hypothetical protein VIU12_03680 [Chryseolinea sp.]
MENFKAIEFHRTRDFSNKVNITFEFLRQNFKGLGKSLLFIAGPPVIVTGLMMGSFMTDLQTLTSSMTRFGSPDMVTNSFNTPTFWLQILLMVVFSVVSSVMALSTINNYIVLYDEKKTNKIEFSEVWERVRSTFWMYFGTVFFLFLLLIAVYLVVVIVMIVLVKISSGLAVLAGFAVFFFLFYAIIAASLTFIIRTYEKMGFFEAIGRSFMLVRGKWWSTFGLLFVLALIGAVISYIFAIPYYALAMVNALHSTSTETFEEPSSSMGILSVVFFSLYYMVQVLLSSLPNLGIAFQYFNLVERKEAPGLMKHIDNLGTEGPVSSHEEQY